MATEEAEGYSDVGSGIFGKFLDPFVQGETTADSRAVGSGQRAAGSRAVALRAAKAEEEATVDDDRRAGAR